MDAATAAGADPKVVAEQVSADSVSSGHRMHKSVYLAIHVILGKACITEVMNVLCYHWTLQVWAAAAQGRSEVILAPLMVKIGCLLRAIAPGFLFRKMAKRALRDGAEV